MRKKAYSPYAGPVVHFTLTAFVVGVVLFTDTDSSISTLYITKPPASPLNCGFSVISCLFDFLFLLFVAEALYIKCITMSPGVVTPNPNSQVSAAARQRMSAQVNGRAPSWTDPPPRDVEAGGFNVDLNMPSTPTSSTSDFVLPEIWCELCDVRVPLRARHCYDCGHCISRFDHHCPWVSQCVGRSNHRIFLLFLLAKSVLLAVAMKSLWYSMLPMEILGSVNFFLMHNKTQMVAFVVCCLAILASTLLFWFHFYLALTDTTTFEFIKARALKYLQPFVFTSPFHRGYMQNVVRFLVPPTQHCATLDEEDRKVWETAFERVQQYKRKRALMNGSTV